MRVPSVLGVSAVMTPLADELVAVTGEAHVMASAAALATAEGETTAAGLAAPVEPVVPDDVLAVVPEVVPAVVPAVVPVVVPDVVAAVPPDPLVEPVAAAPEAVPDVLDDVLDALAVVPAPPLTAAVEPELAGSLDPPPPPPQAANASTTE